MSKQTLMTDIEGYIPNWLNNAVKISVARAIKYDKYEREYAWWVNNWPLGLLYFQYYYFQEVIIDYINTHGDWGEEQIKEGKIFNSRRLN